LRNQISQMPPSAGPSTVAATIKGPMVSVNGPGFAVSGCWSASIMKDPSVQNDQVQPRVTRATTMLRPVWSKRCTIGEAATLAGTAGRAGSGAMNAPSRVSPMMTAMMAMTPFHAMWSDRISAPAPPTKAAER
jgi:hypothetical protein